MASSADLITLVVSGTFSVLPNRTIAIDRPTIDPSNIPVPIKSELIPTSTSTSGPFLVAPGPGNHLNDKLRIGLLTGLLGPIVLCIIITLFVRYRTAVLAKKHKIKFSFLFNWHDLTPGPAPGSLGIGLNPVLNVPSGTHVQTAKGIGKKPRLTLSKTKIPSNVGTRLNKKGQVEYYCMNHDCPIDPKTWRCQQSGDEVDPQFRTTVKPRSGGGSGAGPSMSQV